jgi:SAM-dependent methyltransferase
MEKTSARRNPQDIWDWRSSRHKGTTAGHNYEPWLERWQPLLEAGRGVPVLDLGCGLGYDSLYLTGQGFQVIAADFSSGALRTACRTATQARAVQLNLGQGLPFPDGTFRTIVANLSLHYFSQAQTQRIVADVRRCLRMRGILFARFNSTRDYNHGAVGHAEIEPGYFIVNGMPKRFFDQYSVQMLFQAGWRAHSIEEQVVHCYSKSKVVWETVVEKEQHDASITQQEDPWQTFS